jgi:hypothetical protein
MTDPEADNTETSDTRLIQLARLVDTSPAAAAWQDVDRLEMDCPRVCEVASTKALATMDLVLNLILFNLRYVVPRDGNQAARARAKRWKRSRSTFPRHSGSTACLRLYHSAGSKSYVRVRV